MARGHFIEWPYPPGFVSHVWETALDVTAGHFDHLPCDVQQQVLRHAINLEGRMEYWNLDQMHGLPNIPPLHHHNNNRTATPPMPLPLVDSHLPTLDRSLAASTYGGDQDSFNSASNWTSGWASSGYDSSPFRQEIHHGLPIIGTVSPEQLHPPSHQAMMSPGNDDMSVFTFSDSDGSLPGYHFQQPPYPVSSGRRFKNTTPRTNDPSLGSGFVYGHHPHGGQRGLFDQPPQQQQQQQPRRPLPSGRHRASQGGHVRSSGRRLDAAVTRYSPSAQPHQQSQPVLRGNGLSPTSGHSAVTTSSPRARLGVIPASTRREAASRPVPTSLAPGGPPGFPPGQDLPGFVPIGEERVASRAQGNDWPIARDLMERIVAAERNLGGGRGKESQLTYKQIKAKYSRWKISESTLRGIKRVYDLPKEHRERVPTWNDEHIHALRRAVPCCTDYKGHVAWGQIVELIKRDTGKPYGATTVRKKWQELVRNGLDQQPEQSQSGGEEGDNEGAGDDSSEALDRFSISDDEPL